MQYSSQFLSRKIVFIAACMSVSACLQIFAEHFIYWSTHLLDEFWRLWTGHWVHVGWIHYALNMVAFACLPFIFPHLKNRYAILLLVLLPPLISLSFYFCIPQVEAYAGLSGVLHGLYGAAAIYFLQFNSERKFAFLVISLALAKVLWENFMGSLQTSQLIGSPVLTEAHWIGLVWGIVLALCYMLYEKLMAQKNQTTD